MVRRVNNPLSRISMQALPIRHVMWALVSLATPLVGIALWLINGSLIHPRAVLAGTLMLVVLVVVPMLLWVAYRGVVARDAARHAQVEHMRSQVAASDARLGAIIESAMDAVIVTDAARCILVFNAAAERMLGYAAVDIIGRSLEMLLPERHRGAHPDAMRDFAATGQTNRRMGAGEVSARHADGREIPVEVSISRAVTDGTVFFTAILRDVTARKQTEAAMLRLQRMYGALVRTGQAVTRGRDRDELLHQACEIVVVEGGLAGCWIGITEQQRVLPVAQFGMDPDYIAQARITLDPDDVRSRGPSAKAILTGKPYICNDFMADPGTGPWRETATAHGLRASAAFPLRVDDEVAGALCVYATERDYFTPDLIELLSEVASELSFGMDAYRDRELREEAEGIMRRGYEELGVRVRERTMELFEANERLRQEIAERERTEAALRRSDARFNEAQRVGRVGSWELDLVSDRLEWSNEIFRMFEIDAQHFGASYDAFLSVIHPDDRERVNRAYTESVGNRTPYDIVHRLRMADGRIKYVREHCETFYDDAGRPIRSIGTVQDITQQALAEREANRLLRVLEASRNEIYVFDETTLCFQYVNQSALQNLGYSIEQMRTMTPADIKPDLTVDAFEALIKPLRDGVQEKIDFQTRHARTDGSMYFVEVHLQRVAAEEGSVFLAIILDVTQRTRVEQEVKRTHELLQAILDSTPDWIFIKDPEFRYLMVNKGFAGSLGRCPEDMIGRVDSDFHSHELCEGDPERGIRGFHADDRAALSGQFVHNPYDRATDADGVLRVFDTLKMPLRDPDGRIYGVLGYARDVTERSETEHRIRVVNETLEARVRERTAELEVERTFVQTVLDTAGALVFVVDAQGCIIRVNRALCQTVGRSAQNLIGQPIVETLTPPSIHQELTQLLGRMVSTGESVLREVPVRDADGGWRTVDWTASPIFGPSGNVEYVVGAGMDVTARRDAERALRENEQLLREVTDNIRQVIFVRDTTEERMIFVNPAYEEIWGHPRQRLYDDPRAFIDGVHPDDKPAVIAALEAQARDGRYFNLEYRVTRSDGDRWVWVRTFPIKDDTGAVYRVAGLAEDITDRREAEEVRLQYLRAQRDNLVREVHHRIKNNLQGVAGLLRNHIARAPAARDVLENVITQIHAVALVHGLQGRAGYDEVRLCDVVAAVCDAITSLTGAVIERDLPALKNGQCAYVEPEEAVPVSLIVNELMVNAVKHRAPGTTVQVAVEIATDLARVVIRNQGRPLPEEFSFAAGRGLGVGLTLVRSLMPPETAQIDYHNNEVDIITSFTVHAPTVTVRG